MAYQRLIPGGPLLDETGARQALIPGGPAVNENVVTTISADLAVTEANDTLAAASTLAIVASFGKTEAADSIAADAVGLDGAFFNATEAGDTLLTAAANEIRAVLAIVEDGDTSAIGPLLAIAASLAVTEADDTLLALATGGGTQPEVPPAQVGGGSGRVRKPIRFGRAPELAPLPIHARLHVREDDDVLDAMLLTLPGLQMMRNNNAIGALMATL